ncbi:hypothetical protein ACFXAS_33715 [Streptomyces sp. NPDC059459]|uniref:hypothetical protein n=1 Tax=Streptomyces sp. NPDC059459 TaxID=3346839 RepID=UPI0036BD8FA3
MPRLAFNTAGAALVTAVAASALLVPATSASAAPDPDGRAVGVAVDSIDATCRSHSRNYVVRKYYRGPQFYTLRCGTKTWGWKHIKARHGWNATMDKKISTAIWSGSANGRGGYSTYTNSCPRIEKFRTIIGTPAGTNDLLTAYKVNQSAAAATAAKC